MVKIIGYIFLITTSYVTGGHCLGEKCTENLDCPTQNSVCVEQKCVCHEMSFEHESKCLTLVVKYQGYCEINEQCQWLGGNSTCLRSRCVCNDNYRWFQGKCRPYVDKGGKCDPQTDCYNGYDYHSLKCDDKKQVCICNDGYYDRGQDCRKMSQEGSDCAIDLDCQNSQLTCEKGIKCVKKTEKPILLETEDVFLESIAEKSGEIINRENGTIKCYIDEDCGKIGNSECDVQTEMCQCLPGTYFYQDNCIPGFSPCGNDSQCSQSNMECFKGSSCVCKPGYYANGGSCHPELGVTDPALKSQTNCLIRPSFFQDNTCFCKNYWFNDETNLKCIKPMAQQFNNCAQGSPSCTVMGLYSYCNSSTHTCSCNEYSKLNKTNFMCEKKSDMPKDACLRDYDCNLNEICNADKCECISDFSRDKNGECLPGIGGSCEISPSLCSHIENAKCAGGTCVCPRNTSYVEKAKKCLKTADHINEECEDLAQCQNIQHTVCDIPEGQNNTIKRCICEEEFVEIETVCFKKKQYGDPCMTSKDCTKVLNNSFQCRNSICQCPVHYKLRNGYCQRSGSLSLVPTEWIVTTIVLMTALKAFLGCN